ncbi:helix-turn-helix domain-containing protein [Oleiharenicola lentus]|uniref:helix-turn-helix domain-containing protein n=1 Tax=Oleiharenicola lentus TaxID=2508720 RepID=UPI003F666189
MASRSSHSRPKDAWLKALGRNVREQRKSAKLTQEKLAELADLAPRTIQKIEAGQLDIMASTVRRIRASIGCSYEDLMTP